MSTVKEEIVPQHPSNGIWTEIVMRDDGYVNPGPWVFRSFGAGICYEGFHRADGTWVPLSAVREARR